MEAEKAKESDRYNGGHVESEFVFDAVNPISEACKASNDSNFKFPHVTRSIRSEQLGIANSTPSGMHYSSHKEIDLTNI